MLEDSDLLSPGARIYADIPFHTHAILLFELCDVLALHRLLSLLALQTQSHRSGSG